MEQWQHSEAKKSESEASTGHGRLHTGSGETWQRLNSKIELRQRVRSGSEVAASSSSSMAWEQNTAKAAWHRFRTTSCQNTTKKLDKQRRPPLWSRSGSSGASRIRSRRIGRLGSGCSRIHASVMNALQQLANSNVQDQEAITIMS